MTMLNCKLKKVGSIIGWVLIVVLSLSLLSMVITEKTTGKKSLFGYMPMVVVSESMLPNLEVGDFIIGKPVEASELQIGDVAAYRLTSPVANKVKITIVHRVVDVTDAGLIFKGDNNSECDALVEPEQVLYKIVYPRN